MLALAARARGEFQQFYDLAWRTVQTGPRDDAPLLYLLARAQSLSGRPRDALVILTRLLDRGTAVDARGDPDFERARRLPGWAELEARMSVAEPAATAELAAPLFEPRGPTPPVMREVPAPAVLPLAAANVGAAVAVAPAPALRFDLLTGVEVSRFSRPPFAAQGLAWDPASRRFLLADAQGRRVIVVAEGSDHSDDLVRASSAQFNDVAAVEIDARRGDLWVVSADPDRGVSALHRLQLISGRALAIFEAPAELGAVRLSDLAITSAGTVLMLDTAASRVLTLPAGGKEMALLMPLEAVSATSIASAGDERTVYVAHRDGILRLDLQRRTALPLAAPRGVDLLDFQQIRWQQGALVGVQRQRDGSTHVLRLPIDRIGAATEAVVIDVRGPGAPPCGLSVAGDDVYYLTAEEKASPDGRPQMVVAVTRLKVAAP
jgi:hypothetical protein